MITACEMLVLPSQICYFFFDKYGKLGKNTFQAKRFAESIPNAVWTNQFDNTINRQAHIETTGPEIWSQTGVYVLRNL